MSRLNVIFTGACAVADPDRLVTVDLLLLPLRFRDGFDSAAIFLVSWVVAVPLLLGYLLGGAAGGGPGGPVGGFS